MKKYVALSGANLRKVWDWADREDELIAEHYMNVCYAIGTIDHNNPFEVQPDIQKSKEDGDWQLHFTALSALYEYRDNLGRLILKKMKEAALT